MGTAPAAAAVLAAAVSVVTALAVSRPVSGRSHPASSVRAQASRGGVHARNIGSSGPLQLSTVGMNGGSLLDLRRGGGAVSGGGACGVRGRWSGGAGAPVRTGLACRLHIS